MIVLIIAWAALFGVEDLAMGDELLVNGGFETGDLSGWTESVSQGYVVAVSGEGIEPCAQIDPNTPRSGAFLFSSCVADGAVPGTEEISLVQVIDVSGYPSIPTGSVTIAAEGYVSGANGCTAPSNDLAELSIAFYENGQFGDLISSIASLQVDPSPGAWVLIEIGPTQVPPNTDTIVFRYMTLLDFGFTSIDIGVDDLSLSIEEFTSVNESGPQRVWLHENHPNPFNPATTLRFSIPRPGDVRLDVFDGTGRWIASVAGGSFTAGSHSQTWNGRDHSGRPAPSGIYFARLQAGDFTATRKMVLVK